MAKLIQTTSDAETELHEIREQAEECRRLRGVLEDCKEQTKQASDDYDAANDHLNAMILDKQDRPLLEREGE